MKIEDELQASEPLKDKLNTDQIIVSSDVSMNYEIDSKFGIALKSACQNRLDSIWQYSLNRIDRINKNIDSFHAETNDSGDSIIRTSLMTVRNVCEDWVDVIHTSLKEIKSNISIVDSKNKLNKEISRAYPAEKQTLNKNGITRMMWDGLEQSGELDNFTADQTYRFNKSQITKNVILDLVDKSDLLKTSAHVMGRNNIEEYCYNGVVTGMFAIMNSLEPINNVELDCDNGRAIRSQAVNFKFRPVDPRSLFFSKSSKMSWFAHMQNISFSDLLASATDDNGEQNQNSLYNLNRLKALAKYLKDDKPFPSVTELSDNDLDFDNTDMSEMLEMEGILTVWEFHYIPIIFKDDKLPTRSLITAVSIGSSESLDQCPPDLFIIGARKTPYIFGLPLHTTNFAYNLKTKDPQGVGLPQIMEEISDRTQKTLGQTADLINRALMGIHFVGEDYFDDIAKLENLKSRMFIPMKNTNGLPISSVIGSWQPDTAAINLGMQFLEMLKQAGKSIARSGLSGESIKSGQVSATEFASVKQELDKQNLRPMMRIAGNLESWLLDMYRYSAMYVGGPVSVLCKGERYFDEMDKVDKDMGAPITETSFEHDKEVTLTVEEWFTNGLGMELKGITSMQSDAIAKQQAMEAINLIMGKGLVIDPQTGQPIVITDEDGKRLTIDIKSIIEQALTALGYDGVWMPAQEMIAPPGMPGMPPGMPGVPTDQSSGVNNGGIPVQVDKPGESGIIGG